MSKTCPACSTGNRPIARFCKKCAAPLTPAPAAPAAVRTACAACGKPNRAGAHFCRSCGQAMDSTAVAAIAPRLVQPDQPTGAAAGVGAPGSTASPRRPAVLAVCLALVLALALAAWWLQRNGAASTAAPELLAPTTAPAAPLEQTPAGPSQPVEPASEAASGVPEPAIAMPAAPQAEPSASVPIAAQATAPPPPAPRPTPDTATEPSASTGDASTPSGALPAPAAPAAVRARPVAPPRQPAARRGPETACADSNALARTLCISFQCVKSEFRQHPTCVRLENEARERRQFEIDNGMVGG